jgi:hypothetical protein
MTTHRAWYGDEPKTRIERRDAIDKPHASRFPVQYGIEELQKELLAYNERIVELENEGQRPYPSRDRRSRAEHGVA